MTADVSELRMNVAALKRVDPYVKDILETATHVALYTFNGDKNEWEKTEIEGALFVYSRIGEPYNSILIMNRLNTKNQVEPVTPGLDLQLQEPFLLYKNSKGQIYGIWFYDTDECVRISSMLNKLAKDSESKSKSTTRAKKQSSSSSSGSAAATNQRKQQQQHQHHHQQQQPSNIDIFSMLSKAQEDFNSGRGNNNNNNNNNKNNSKSPMSNAMGELSGALTAMSMAPDVTSKSVMDFFAKAKVTTEHFKKAGGEQAKQVASEAGGGKPLLARLMSHPAAHTLEHIEKQHRSITPVGGQQQQQQQTAAQQQQQGVLMNNQSCENLIMAKLRQKMHSNTNVSSSSSQMIGQVNSTCRPMNCSELPGVMNSDESNCSSSFHRIQSPTGTRANNLVNRHKSANVSNFIGGYEPLHHQNTSASGNTDPRESLYQDMSSSVNILPTPLTPKSNSMPVNSQCAAPALIPPGMFAAPASPATLEPLHRPVEPLTRNQLLQAFNYLLRTDPDFVNKLHEAYVKSFSEILP